MPRNVSGVYALPPAYLVGSGDDVLPTQHNSPLEDLEADANEARPVVAGGTGASTAAGARTNLGVAIGSDVQAHGDVLDDLNTLGANAADGEFLVGTGAGALAWESGATARTSLGVAIGTDVQAYDATLTSIAALGTAADRFAYTTGVDTWAEAALTAFARTLLDDADQATAQATLGVVPGTDVQGYDADLAAIAGLTSAADKLPYFTGSETAGLADFTAFARTLLDDADAATARGTLGLDTTDTVSFGIVKVDGGSAATPSITDEGDDDTGLFWAAADTLGIATGGSERARMSSAGHLSVATTSISPASSNIVGAALRADGVVHASSDGAPALEANRAQDGTVVRFRSAGAVEGSIDISGSTTSLVGAHLSRWSRLLSDDPAPETALLRGTVMSNLDEMIKWKYVEIDVEREELVRGTDRDEEGLIPMVFETRIERVRVDYHGEVGQGRQVDVEFEGKTCTAMVQVEVNEQLNHTKISDVVGDKNVAGVFGASDTGDGYQDYKLSMTGDEVIRIRGDVTVERGDLLMSAGDGTAMPQDDDLVRSCTVAKVSSTTRTIEHPDGSYCVPCTLMVA